MSLKDKLGDPNNPWRHAEMNDAAWKYWEPGESSDPYISMKTTLKKLKEDKKYKK